LKVLDPGARLQVVVTGGGTENDWVAVEVEAPDGATTFVYEGDTEVTAQVMDPAAGDYVVRVVASPTDSPLGVDYSATATLLGAVGPTPTPSATASATATATPTPSATARRLRIADQRATDVQVAAAPVAVGEGRKIHTLRFPSKLRKRLLRMKRLDLAIEATVTDPDGRRRTATDRITLGR
jgi:hypothetical protein